MLSSVWGVVSTGLEKTVVSVGHLRKVVYRGIRTTNISLLLCCCKADFLLGLDLFKAAGENCMAFRPRLQWFRVEMCLGYPVERATFGYLFLRVGLVMV